MKKLDKILQQIPWAEMESRIKNGKNTLGWDRTNLAERGV
jgi:hypothetical protein